jgi:hypothetical protein
MEERKGQLRQLSDDPSRGGRPRERPTCDAFSKQWRFAAIVINSGRLPGRGGLFERNAVTLNEVEDFFGRSRRDRRIEVQHDRVSARPLLAVG